MRRAGGSPARCRRPRTAAVRELRDPASGELLDEALVLRFDSPASSTGEDIVEFQCHGGRAVVDALLDALASSTGCGMAEPGEFTRRAFENGRIDLTEAEGLADLIEAETESQRKAALALAEGGLSKQIAEWQERLLGLSAEAERAIDYDEEDEAVDPALQRECGALAAELRLARAAAGRAAEGRRESRRRGSAECRKIKPSQCDSWGGAGDRHRCPGTTRDHIEVPLSLGGVPILLTDTAGLRETADEVEAIGVARAERLIAAADVLLWLGEPGDAPAIRAVILRPCEGGSARSSARSEGLGRGLVGHRPGANRSCSADRAAGATFFRRRCDRAQPASGRHTRRGGRAPCRPRRQRETVFLAEDFALRARRSIA